MTYCVAEFCVNGHFQGHTEVESRENPWEQRKTTRRALVDEVEGKNLYVNTPRCPKCGSEVINRCPKCRAYLRGNPEMVHSTIRNANGFCWKCGAPLPWTEAAEKALQNVISELEESFPDEIPEHIADQLREVGPDLMTNTQKTELAVFRYGKAIKCLKGPGAKLLSEVLTKVATDAVLRKLGFKDQ